MNTNLEKRDKLTREEVLYLSMLDDMIKQYDAVIHIGKTAYPSWVKMIMNPETVARSKTEYDIKNIKEWLHPKQSRGIVKGETIYKFLQDDNLIKDCLGIADLCAIRVKGAFFFRKYFMRKAEFGWKSVVQVRGGNLLVPFIFEISGRVLVLWRFLSCYWGSHSPALRLSE